MPPMVMLNIAVPPATVCGTTTARHSSPRLGRRWRGNRNRLPNLQLLEGRSNGSKNDMPLIEYYNDMNDDQKAEFRNEAFIPDDVGLELEHFEEFYEKRKALLTIKIRQLLG